MPLSSPPSLHSLHILVCRAGPDNAQAAGACEECESMIEATSSPNSWTLEPCPHPSPSSKYSWMWLVRRQQWALNTFTLGKWTQTCLFQASDFSVTSTGVSKAPAQVRTCTFHHRHSCSWLSLSLCMLGWRSFPSKNPHEDTIVSLTLPKASAPHFQHSAQHNVGSWSSWYLSMGSDLASVDPLEEQPQAPHSQEAYPDK